MVTIHRAHGLRFMIFIDDHEPAHVHVFGAGEMKIVIRGADGLPEVVDAIAMKAGDRRRALDVVREQQSAFLTLWHEIHGEKP